MAKREELEGDEDVLPEPTDDTTPEDDDTDGDIGRLDSRPGPGNDSVSEAASSWRRRARRLLPPLWRPRSGPG
jgi:hypothetical protein